MEKELTKNEKGITLVALIITIIVLLILAVVSIRAIKDGGILSKTQTAKETYSEAEEEEKVKLAVHEAAIDGTGNIEKEHLESAVKNQFKPRNTQVNESNNDFLVTIENSENEYLVSKDGNITKKAPSNIKYVFRGLEEAANAYLVILKNNNTYLIENGQKAYYGKYSEGTKASEIKYYQDNNYTIDEDVEALDKFVICDNGWIVFAIKENKVYTLDNNGNHVSLRENTAELVNDVDLSQYEF